MDTAANQREDIMTDFQFKALLKMILDIAERTDDVQEIRKSLKAFIGEQKQESNKDD